MTETDATTPDPGSSGTLGSAPAGPVPFEVLGTARRPGDDEALVVYRRPARPDQWWLAAPSEFARLVSGSDEQVDGVVASVADLGSAGVDGSLAVVARRRRGRLSPFRGEFSLEQLNGATGLATVFLVVELGWEQVVAVRQDPRPILIALLCFFHLVVYWLNFCHLYKFAEAEDFSIAQTWTLALYCLGMVFYPISMGAWIEGRNPVPYIGVNLVLCLLLNVWVRVTAFRGGNRLYDRYRTFGPPAAAAAYLTVLALALGGVAVGAVLWCIPVAFAVPLGGAADE